MGALTYFENKFSAFEEVDIPVKKYKHATKNNGTPETSTAGHIKSSLEQVFNYGNEEQNVENKDVSITILGEIREMRMAPKWTRWDDK